MTHQPFNRAVETLARMLERHTGQELSEARRWRVETSLRPLLRSHDLKTLDDLVFALGAHPSGPLFNETIDLMLNHESSFYRDPAVFRSIENAILPMIIDNATDKRLRIWCAGCSTGKEAYSIAMILKRLGQMLDGWRITILATDVSPLVIEEAKRGRFTQMEMQRGLGINDLLRWFSPVGDQWQIHDQIREMVSFHVDNLMTPRAVSGDFDLILCRNVLFYFPEDKRKDAFANLARHAHVNSFVVLGAGETLVGKGTKFMPMRNHGCIYRHEDAQYPIISTDSAEAA